MPLHGGSFQADISPDVVAGTPLIKGYGDDYFMVGRERYNHTILLHQNTVISHPKHKLIDDSLLTLLDNVLHHHVPDIFILGTGRRICFPPESIHEAFSQAQIGFEFMDSRAAARTYNIIVSEGRTVSAFLFSPKMASLL